MKLTGWEAIEYAEANGALLNKYADPTEDALAGVSLSEARVIAGEDAGLLWIEVVPARYCVRVIGSGEFGSRLFFSDDAAAAKAKADDLGSAYEYGVAVIDSETKTADLGHRVVPVAEVFDEEDDDLEVDMV